MLGLVEGKTLRAKLATVLIQLMPRNLKVLNLWFSYFFWKDFNSEASKSLLGMTLIAAVFFIVQPLTRLNMCLILLGISFTGSFVGIICYYL